MTRKSTRERWLAYLIGSSIGCPFVFWLDGWPMGLLGLLIAALILVVWDRHVSKTQRTALDPEQTT